MEKSNLSFTGSIPENYDVKLGPIIFEEYALDLAKRVKVPASGKVLEIAAGTGIVTKNLRDQLSGDIRIMVTDLNEAMLDFAKAKFPKQENMEFQTENASKLSFDSDSFDTVICQFSIMFFPDKLEALKEAKRVLKPGGELIFSIWDSYEHNHLAKTVNEIISGLYPNNPIKFYDVPYCYNDIDEVKDLLKQAGFGDVEVSILPKYSYVENARDVATAFILGTPVSMQIIERDKIDLEKVLDIVENSISVKHGRTSIKAKMQAIVFKASL